MGKALFETKNKEKHFEIYVTTEFQLSQHFSQGVIRPLPTIQKSRVETIKGS